MDTVTQWKDELSQTESQYIIYYDTYGNKMVDQDEFNENCKEYQERIIELRKKIRNYDTNKKK